MIVGGDLGDGLLVLDLGLFGLARGDLFRSGLLLGQLRGERCFALTYGDSFPKEIVNVVDSFIRGDLSLWDDVLEDFVLLAKVLHVIKEKLGYFGHSPFFSILTVSKKDEMLPFTKVRHLPSSFFWRNLGGAGAAFGMFERLRKE